METSSSKHWAFKIRHPDLLPPPGPLAEAIDPQLALNAMRNNMTLKRPEGRFHSAWTHVEYALNQSVALQDDVRKKYMDDAAHLLGGILARPERTTQDIYLGVLTLSAYLPLFTKRAVCETITTLDCDNLYVSLGSVIDEARLSQFDGAVQWRLGEVIFDAGAARTRQPELLLFPTSPREESCANQPQNHDRYFIRGQDKAPLQLKMFSSEKTYESPIITLVVMPILDNALRVAGYGSDHDPEAKLTLLLDTIVSETSGTELSDQQQVLLNRFSRSVASRYRFVPKQRSA